MRIVFYALLAVYSLTACQQRPAEKLPQPPAAANITVVSVPAKSVQTLAQRFSPIISGFWVSKQYLDAVQRTRSPEAAFDSTPPGPSSIRIDLPSNATDSVQIGASYGLHEGGEIIILLQSYKNVNSVLLKPQLGDKKNLFSELAYEISPKDTTLFFVERNTKTNQVVSKIPYHRVLKTSFKDDLQNGVEYGINQLLLTGKYAGLDSLSKQVNAQFLANGNLVGLPFEKYVVQTDFAGPNPGDELIFDVYTKQQLGFAADYGRDTLRLYTIRSIVGGAAGASDTTITFSRGRLRYQLVRIK